MIEFELRKGEDYIELNNLLKVLNLVSTGGEAKIRISNGEVEVNDKIETQKRKKLRPGDKVFFSEESITIV